MHLEKTFALLLGKPPCKHSTPVCSLLGRLVHCGMFLGHALKPSGILSMPLAAHTYQCRLLAQQHLRIFFKVCVSIV
jgi:hypothetical protein